MPQKEAAVFYYIYIIVAFYLNVGQIHANKGNWLALCPFNILEVTMWEKLRHPYDSSILPAYF